MDSSLDVSIAKKQIGPDVEAAIGDTSWPMWSLVPGEDSSTGNVTGGRKLARYVLEAVVGRCAGCRYGPSFLGARRDAHNRPPMKATLRARMSTAAKSAIEGTSKLPPAPSCGPWRPTYATANDGVARAKESPGCLGTLAGAKG